MEAVFDKEVGGGRNSKERTFRLTATGEEIGIRQVFDVDVLGGTVWRGAALLCGFLLHRFGGAQPSASPAARPLVLELGSGCGLCSIVAAKTCNWRIVSTDLDEVTGLMLDNVARNGCGKFVDVEEHAWGALTPPKALQRRYEYVIAAEVLYEPELVEPLLRSLLMFTSAPSRSTITADYPQGVTTVYLANDTRAGDAARMFFTTAAKYFDVTRFDSDDTLEFYPEWGPLQTEEEGVFVLKRNGFSDYRSKYCAENFKPM
jgi:hypothetical protein